LQVVFEKVFGNVVHDSLKSEKKPFKINAVKQALRKKIQLRDSLFLSTKLKKRIFQDRIINLNK